MTEGQKVHRLLGLINAAGKKTIFYEDLLEDFNEGLWFGKIQETDLRALCDILVRDELADYVTGSHAAAAVPSGRDDSKGITIHNTAFTAFVNKKYDEGGKAKPIAKTIAVILGIGVIGLGVYVFYLRYDRERMLHQAEREYIDFEREVTRAARKQDSTIKAMDAVIKQQADRIKALETPPPPKPAPKKKPARRR